MTGSFKTIQILLIAVFIFLIALCAFLLLYKGEKETRQIEFARTLIGGERIFNTHCASCHHVTGAESSLFTSAYSRYDSAWLRSWIINSSKMIADSDRLAVAISEEYPGATMPDFSMPKEDLDSLMFYLKYIASH